MRCPPSIASLMNSRNIVIFAEGESILLMMNELKICASSGSACTSGSLEPSHVLRAMGIPFTAAHGSIRFSLSHHNTEKEMDFIFGLISGVRNIRSEMNIQPSMRIKVLAYTEDEKEKIIIAENKSIIVNLAALESFYFCDAGNLPSSSATRCCSVMRSI